MKVGKPLEDYMDQFNHHQVGDIEVYLNKYVDLIEEEIHIDYLKTTFQENLTVTGVA